MVAPLTNLTGIILRSLIDAGVALVRTVYWVSPIFTVPDGGVRWAGGPPFFGITTPHDLAIFSARRCWQRHARYRSHLLSNAVVAVVVELLLVEAIGTETELAHGNAW